MKLRLTILQKGFVIDVLSLNMKKYLKITELFLITMSFFDRLSGKHKYQNYRNEWQNRFRPHLKTESIHCSVMIHKSILNLVPSLFMLRGDKFSIFYTRKRWKV